MNLRESTGIAFAALRANKMRSFLTLLGTIIGVMAVIAVMSLVHGLNTYVSQKLLNAGANVFWVDPYGFVTSQEEWDKVKDRPPITLDDAEALQSGLGSGVMIVAQADLTERIHYKDREMRAINIRGRGPGWEVVEDYTVASGRNLSDLDDARRQLVCVIGSEVADELFPSLDALGHRIRVGQETYEVVGVMEAKGKLLGQPQDRFVTIPMRTFQKFKQQRGTIQIAVKSPDQASMPTVQQEVRNILRARRHLGPLRPDNFGITTSDNVMQLYQTIMGGIFVVTIGVAGISLLVGGIVIMNIMLVSVTERTREIGVRKAMGARRRDILSQFLVEAATLSVSGGAIGILGGILMALLVLTVFHLPAGVSVPAIVLGIAMSVGIGVFFGSYPAWRAARLDPVEALRYE
jgi:putative ABC transport system permease protein